MIKSIFLLFIIIGIAIFIFQMLTASNLKFTSSHDIEINSVVDYTKFIEKVKNGQIDEVEIDSSKVNVNKVGTYEVIYKLKKEEKILKVHVVDTTPPSYEVVERDVALNQSVDPQILVKNVKDASQTKIYFEKDYHFSKVGQQNVSIIVEDEYKNKTVKAVQVNVVKDEEAPVITAGNISVLIDSEVDFYSYVNVKDNLDVNPTVQIQSEEVKLNKIGSYPLKIIAKDASGNQSEKAITVQVIDKTGDSEKVVYLTFDDGPSRHTEEVLEILDRYDCKATFFITGMNPSYRKYIKIAHDKGHTIGLHTYSHNYAKVYASIDAYFDDLEKIGNLAKDYIGYVPKYIRFPGGGSNTVSAKYSKGIMTKLTKMVEEKGYIYYDWNAENGDGYTKMTKSEMLKRATSSSQNKIMILMHDANGKQNTVDILPKVIEYYQKKGYTFKAIDDSAIVPHQRVNN